MKFTDEELRRCRDTNEIHDLQSQLEDVTAERDALASENARLREFAQYWSYCTWQGMRQWAPEKQEELRSGFVLHGVDFVELAKEHNERMPGFFNPPHGE